MLRVNPMLAKTLRNPNSCETNSLANAYQVPVDDRFRDPA